MRVMVRTWTGRSLRAVLLGAAALVVAASCGGVASQPSEQGSGGNAGTGGESDAGSGGGITTAGNGSGGRGAGGIATAGTTSVAGSGSGAVAGSFNVDAGSMGPQVGVRCEEVTCLPGQACIYC